ncbi:class I SAM-dependent methyltransferase [Pedobacter sp.]
MKSKITGGATEKIFSATILNKHQVDYYKCLETGFIQTEEPYWLEEAYSSAITKLDVGLVYRNEDLRGHVVPMLSKYFNAEGLFLDYAGGYGLFTRMMRDKGFNFYHTDAYCKNIFAEYFDLDDLPKGQKFELLTAFEVFEHLPNPLEEIEKMSSLADNILFSTVLVPQSPLNSVNDWWYFIPETGQHVAMFTVQALEYLANKLGYRFYTNGDNLHLFTKSALASNPFQKNKEPFLVRKARKILKKFNAKNVPEKETLLMKDWEYIKTKLS